MQTFSLELVPRYFDFAKKGDVIVFDTETTGFKDSDEIVELAVVLMRDGEVVLKNVAYLQNQVKIDGTEAQTVNGLTDEFLSLNGRPPAQVLTSLLMLIGESIERKGECLLVAHNLPFDLRMLENALAKHKLAGLPKGIIGCDTKEFVKSLNLPKEMLPNNKLASCVDSFALDGENSHDALDDAMACLELFKFLTKE